MANYTISVNGKSYDVTVEKKGGSAAPAATAPTPAVVAPAPAAVAAAPAPAAKAPKTAGGAGATVSAPMPGKVIAVKVKEGDSVKKGQELIMVEAMKMHNPVLAPSDGVVLEIFVKAGDPIQTGTPLVTVG